MKATVTLGARDYSHPTKSGTKDLWTTHPDLGLLY